MIEIGRIANRHDLAHVLYHYSQGLREAQMVAAAESTKAVRVRFGDERKYPGSYSSIERVLIRSQAPRI